MNKEQQDNLWNDLSEETRKEYREKYKSNLVDSKKYLMGDELDKSIVRSETIVKELETMFGVHNLNPQPQIRTWDDVARLYPEIDADLDKAIEALCNYYKNCSIQYIIKCHAALKIQKLIELGYGGTVSNAEWKDDKCRKYTIAYFPLDGRKFVSSDYCIGEYEFVAFHKGSQRDSFISHKENRRLIENYYMV